MKEENSSLKQSNQKVKKVAYLQVLDATPQEVKIISEKLRGLSDELGLFFIITDQQISLHSVDYLIRMLKELKYKEDTVEQNEKE